MTTASTTNEATEKSKPETQALLKKIEALNREMARRRQAEEMLRIIAAGTAAVTGGDFFRPLVQHSVRANVILLLCLGNGFETSLGYHLVSS